MSSAPTRVLLAEDDDKLAEIVAHILTEAGHEVEIARDGASARASLLERDFDVVLSDINMPRMSGVELLRMLRDEGSDTAVVLLTADPRIATAALAVELGASSYLVKPIDTASLLAAVARACTAGREGRRREAALRAEVARARERTDLESSLLVAMDSMFLVFQPIVDARLGTTFGHELLLRTSAGAFAGPCELISAAEATGAVVTLGRKIRRMAAKAIDCVAGDVFVNIHPLELSDPDLCDPEAPLSERSSRVVLEITERAAVGQGADVREQIGALRRLGFRIAVDDLGAGYAGLSSLANLEPEFVKIDMSIVRDVDTSPMKRRLIGAIGPACREASIRVVAEGIETEAELDAIRELGCDLVQGYLLARPASPAPLPTWPRPPLPPS